MTSILLYNIVKDLLQKEYSRWWFHQDQDQDQESLFSPSLTKLVKNQDDIKPFSSSSQARLYLTSYLRRQQVVVKVFLDDLLKVYVHRKDQLRKMFYIDQLVQQEETKRFVRLLGLTIINYKLILVMEQADMSLRQYLDMQLKKEFRVFYDYKEMMYVFIQVTHAMNFLHGKDIAIHNLDIDHVLVKFIQEGKQVESTVVKKKMILLLTNFASPCLCINKKNVLHWHQRFEKLENFQPQVICGILDI